MEKFYGADEKVSKKDWLTSLVLCWFLGFFGVHRLYAGKIGSGFLILYGTIVAACILYLNVYLGAIAFIVMGSFVACDLLNILFKCFKDIHGKEISEDTAIK